MASEQVGLVSNPQLVFHNNNSTFTCGPSPQPQPHPNRVGSVTGDPGPKTTRELTGFIDKYDNHNHNHNHYFINQQPQQGTDFRRQIFRDWDNTKARGDGSDDDDDDDDVDDDDDEDDDGNEVEGIVTVENTNNTNSNSDKVNGNGSKVVDSDKTKSLSTFGVKEGNTGQSGNEGSIDVRNAVTIASVDGDMYYNQYLQGPEGSNAGQKEMGFENGCGFSGRKEGSYSTESGESLRVILSDPITGALMDDAMILPCGHSFGSGGVQHVIRMKACYICSQAVSEESVAPNLSLRDTVQAFRREEESQLNRSLKRRRERYDQDRGPFGDQALSDHLRGRGVQFPFAVTDRVIIKGNKRTPQRFVGREAVVTTQCLNGWYVVKTLDNAESVKLQYRSLAKVSDNLSIQPISSKTIANWL